MASPPPTSTTWRRRPPSGGRSIPGTSSSSSSFSAGVISPCSASRVIISVASRQRRALHLIGRSTRTHPIRCSQGSAEVDAVSTEETEQPQEGSTGPKNYGKTSWRSFSPKEYTHLTEEVKYYYSDGRPGKHAMTKLLEKLKRYGAAGVLSYGLLNTVYYVTTFLLVWFYFSPAPGRMGYAAAVERFIKLMAMVWAGSQVTKILRAGGALALAPFVDRGLRWFTVKFNFQSEGKAFATIVGLCFAFAAIMFFGLTVLWA